MNSHCLVESGIKRRHWLSDSCASLHMTSKTVEVIRTGAVFEKNHKRQP